MTVRGALAEGLSLLSGEDTETPGLHAALLLADACGLDRARLYMRLDEEVDGPALSLYRGNLARRAAGEPVAWITGTKEFWGLPFAVGPGALCPRPDTEALVEAALEAMDAHGPEGRLHDCCCGPGTLALALAVERPRWSVSASDVSREAGAWFARNAGALAPGRVPFFPSDLMEGVDGPFDVLVSNPPYLTPRETADRKALGWKEPALALDGGGADGLDLIRRLVPRAAERLAAGGVLLLEAAPLQMTALMEILTETRFRGVSVRRDLAGRDRVISGVKS